MSDIKEVSVRSVSSNQEAELAKTKAELAAVEAELLQVELETKRETLAKLKRENAAARQTHEWEAQQSAHNAKQDAQNAEQDRIKQANCTHKQGGDGLAGMLQGDDSQYSVNSEYSLLNERTERCNRCDSVWTKADVEKKNGYTFEEISRVSRKGLRAAIPITFTVPGLNAPAPVKS